MSSVLETSLGLCSKCEEFIIFSCVSSCLLEECPLITFFWLAEDIFDLFKLSLGLKTLEDLLWLLLLLRTLLEEYLSGVLLDEYLTGVLFVILLGVLLFNLSLFVLLICLSVLTNT